MKKYSVFVISTTDSAGGPGRNIRPSNFAGFNRQPRQSPSMRLLGRLPSLNMDDDELRRSRSSKSDNN